MDRIIDMSQAHLIPERIKEYVPKVAEILEKYPSIDCNMQRYHELLRSVENRLSREPIASPFFKKTLEKENGRAGLEALKAGDTEWLRMRFPQGYFNIYSAEKLINTNWFPFFFTYVFDNELDQRAALFSLARHFDLPFVPIDERFIVLDINNIMCYITIPKQGGRYDENSTRCQKYFCETQRIVAKTSL